MLLMLRSSMFNLTMIVLTPLFSIALLLVRPFGFKPAWWIARAWSGVMLFLGRALCGMRYRVEGREHLPRQPCVVMAKHQSAWETIAMPQLIPPFVWVLKHELFYIPIFGWALKAVNAIAIRRMKPREAVKQVLLQGEAFLKQGRWVVIFPEGERMPPGKTGNYQASGIMLAQRAHVGILPMAHNAGLCWPKRSFVKRPGLITVRFLPYIPAEEVAACPRHELLERLRHEIEAATRELGG